MNYIFAYLTYWLIKPITQCIEWMLPPRLNRGKRAVALLDDARISLPIPSKLFTHGYYLSLWRSHRLRRFCETAPIAAVKKFLQQNIVVDQSLDELAKLDRGIIFASPHFGAFIPGCLKVIQAMHGKKKVSVFYNDPANTPSNGAYAEIFKRPGYDVEILYVGRKGTLAALRALKRKECVLIMPDVVIDKTATIVVPFMRRLLRVMPGCGFFAAQSDSVIVPLFCFPQDNFSVKFSIDAIIDPRDFASNDRAQDIFMLSRQLFAQFETQFLKTPVYWNYWDRLTFFSRPTGSDSVDFNSVTDIEMLINNKYQDLSRMSGPLPNEFSGAFQRSAAT
jgi:predicted LPLAT superfamily acyltransferase